ncbi:hypothetical protein ACIBHY_26465 [Nonomuraea sp. NPDC050547]|uniref:hypothetical protein n=1 Tax=Nonomuraea sp. NPDC050547 TaxID=3364368 RepID=UPI0037A42F58
MDESYRPGKEMAWPAAGRGSTGSTRTTTVTKAGFIEGLEEIYWSADASAPGNWAFQEVGAVRGSG